MSNPSNPPILALYGGPGTGKSTTMAEVFSILKCWGRNIEQVGEVAKHHTWRKDYKALGHQGLIHGLQCFEYDLLAGEVEGIVTDTSPLLSINYARGRHASREFREYVATDWNSRNTIDVFLERGARPYNTHGRRQSEESARHEDKKILELLDACAIDYHVLPVGGPETAQRLCMMLDQAMGYVER